MDYPRASDRTTPHASPDAARGFDNNLRVRCPDRFAASGEADALRIIGNLFRRDIAAGKPVVFTEDGPIT